MAAGAPSSELRKLLLKKEGRGGKAPSKAENERGGLFELVRENEEETEGLGRRNSQDNQSGKLVSSQMILLEGEALRK